MKGKEKERERIDVSGIKEKRKDRKGDGDLK